jgi:hypothetical protein
MNNKLSLKSLQQELDQLKASASKGKVENLKSSVAHDIKNSYIQNLHMKSSMFYLWLITGILGYVHKIPFISRIISILSVFYGRTTFWKMLVFLRKLFIMFNAVIGMFLVFKTTGFGYDTFLANFVALGNSYLEIFVNFSRRVFQWIVEMLDYKVVPNVPGSGGDLPKFKLTNPWGWYTKPMHDSPLGGRLLDLANSSKELFQSPFNITIDTTSTSWYKSLNFWLWLGGVVASVGVVYLGYKIVLDPSIVFSYFKSGSNPTLPPSDGSVTPTTSVVELNSGRSK